LKVNPGKATFCFDHQQMRNKSVIWCNIFYTLWPPVPWFVVRKVLLECWSLLWVFPFLFLPLCITVCAVCMDVLLSCTVYQECMCLTSVLYTYLFSIM
jgi:hypothetical protein